MRALVLVLLLGCAKTSAPASTWQAWTEPAALCVLTAQRAWRAREPTRSHDLTLPGTSHAFASVRGGASLARLWYAAGRRQERQPIELEDRGIVVRGEISSTVGALWATDSVTMDGHLSTTGLAEYQWQGATAEGLQLSYEPPPDFSPVTPTRLSRACAALSLDDVTLPPSGTRLTATAPGSMPMALITGRAIALYAAPAGNLVGTFSPGAARPVAAVARAVGWLRIISTNDPRYEIDGWIADSDAVAAPAGSVPQAAPSASGPSSTEPSVSAASPQLRCNGELRFAAAAPHAAPRWSGLVRPGTPFAWLGEASPDTTYIGSLAGALQPTTRTSWIALRSELAGCRRDDEAVAPPR